MWSTGCSGKIAFLSSFPRQRWTAIGRSQEMASQLGVTEHSHCVDNFAKSLALICRRAMVCSGLGKTQFSLNSLYLTCKHGLPTNNFGISCISFRKISLLIIIINFVNNDSIYIIAFTNDVDIETLIITSAPKGACKFNFPDSFLGIYDWPTDKLTDQPTKHTLTDWHEAS